MVVVVAGRRLALDSDTGRALIEDIARYVEGLIDNDDLCGAWGIAASELTAIKTDHDVFEAVRATKRRREQDGSAARERARKAFAKAPRVLEHILDDANAPTRAKIEASRELRAAAGFSSDELTGTTESFHITINLGAGDVKQFGLAGSTRRNDNDIVDVTPTHTKHQIVSVPRSDEDD
jgi:hypothetical protein